MLKWFKKILPKRPQSEDNINNTGLSDNNTVTK